MKQRKPFLWSVPAWRAGLEGIAAALLLITLQLSTPNIPDEIKYQGLIVTSILAGSVIGLRQKALSGRTVKRLILLGLITAAVSLGTLRLTLLLLLAFRQPDYLNSPVYSTNTLILLSSGLVYLCWRIFRPIWVKYNDLRRTRFQWSIIHSFLLVLLALMLLVSLLGWILIKSTSLPGAIDSSSSLGLIFLDQLTHMIFPMLLIYSAGLAAAIFVVGPPIILFTYFISRRINQRLSSLAAATHNLSSGDLSARIAVSGEDEIAQLQKDFNNMAEKLEKTTHQLEAERDRVAGLLKAQRELTAVISHELRTPVATLRGYLESGLAHTAPDLPENTLHDLEIMQHETESLQTLIEDLFAVSQAEVNQLSLECRAIGLAELAVQVVESTQPLAWRSGRVELVLDLVQDMPPVWADPMRLEQVLRNLLQNAIRYTPPGGLVAVRTDCRENSIRLSVTDTGPGISAEDLPHVWERFFHAAGSPHGGAGLGLTLVKELTETMGGKVGVESTPSEGSCFWIDLNPAPAAP